MQDILDEVENKEQNKVIGDFKTKKKFIEFVGVRGNMNFISNEALIDGKYLSGLGMDNIVFKITICDDNTINFDEVDTNLIGFDQKKRLIDIIDEKVAVPYNKSMVIQDLPFKSVKKIKSKEINLYLSIDQETPIKRLASIFTDDIEISEEQGSKIDDLLSLFGDIETTEEDVDITIKVSETDKSIVNVIQSDKIIDQCEIPTIDSKNLLEESFLKMKEEKLEELQKRMNQQKSEMKRFEFEKAQAEKKIAESKTEMRVLESRIDSLKIVPTSNGYYFFVSERLNERIVLEDNIINLIKQKLSKVKSINVEGFMKLFEQGEYSIKIGENINSIISEITDHNLLPDDVKKSLNDIGITLEDGKLVYIGDLTWHQIVSKMIKSGFIQDPSFDKVCGSNSYLNAAVSKSEKDFIKKEENIENKEEEMKINKFGDFEFDGLEKGQWDFEAFTGYPVGDDFIFAIGGEDGDPEYISITPKSYWDNENCCYDQHIQDIIVSIPDGFDEVCESVFEYDGSYEEAIEKLVNDGFKFNIEFQKFIDDRFKINGIRVDQYVLKNYPNAII